MKLYDLIKQRRSVRTFNEEVVEQEKLDAIIDCANNATNPYNQKIEWKILDLVKDNLKTPVIVGTNAFIAGKMQKALDCEVAFGYSFEQVVLYAQSLNIGTTWIAGTMDRKSFENAIDVKDGEVMPCVSPLGYVAKKMGIKEVVMRTALKADKRVKFEDIFFDKSFNTPLSQDAAGKLFNAFEMVRLAPSAVNKQPWRLLKDGNNIHFYEKQSLGLNKEGLDIQKIDIGIALYHFVASLKEEKIDCEFSINEPSIDKGDLKYIATITIK